MEDCVIIHDKRTLKPRGFGFVTYESLDSVHKVLENRANHFIEHKWVDVKSAVSIEEMKKIISVEEIKYQKTQAPAKPDPAFSF